MQDNTVAIFGIGRVGLPLGLVFADKGFQVTGIDVDPYRIQLIKHKIMPFMEEGAQELLDKHGGTGFQAFSSEHISRIVPETKILIFTLGTPIDETQSPNFDQIEKSISAISPFIQPGHILIFRSTISPGTTETLARELEKRTKLKVGKDIYLAYCPERIAEGKSVEELVKIPQIIGTIDQESAKKAAEVFEKISPKILFTNSRAAELSKLFCNMYRYIDFAIGNEFMMISEDYGCDIYEVLHLVNEDYPRAGLKTPGFTAGPCLVKDGFFLLDKSPYMELVTAAWRMNENIPGYLLNRIKEHVKDLHTKKIAILGSAFKKNIDDKRFSLSPKLKRYMVAEGANVFVHDPYIDSQPLDVTLKNAEILVIGINHDVFKKLDLREISEVVAEDCLVCDIWNIFGTGKIVFKLKDQVAKMEKPKTNGNGLTNDKRPQLDERRRVQLSNS